MPDETKSREALPPARRRTLLRAQDFAWLLFLVILLVTTPEVNYNAYILLTVICTFQIIEPRLKLFSSKKGQIISIILKLVLSYLLVGWTHGMLSYYYAIFLIPVVSAATIFDLTGVIVVTGIACAAYFSYLLPIFVKWNELPPDTFRDQVTIMSLRAAFFAIIAFLVYEQAKAKRDEMARTQEAAERLAESNRSLRKAEASLRRNERLAALGQLTAGLAHELRNPLGTIKASAEMLTKESTKSRPEVMSEMAGYIGSEVDRMNGLVSRFLDFTRPLQQRPVMAELRSVIDDVVGQQAELAKNCEVTVSVRTSDCAMSFLFDPELLKLAVSNLVQNAIQASGPGQDVEIRCDATDEDVLIFVTDHGAGIQPEHLENIFNPFFTTKPQGTGLGLAIVAKIVDEHRGRINVFSQPGSGSRFEMSLPRNHS